MTQASTENVRVEFIIGKGWSQSLKEMRPRFKQRTSRAVLHQSRCHVRS